MSKSKRKSLAVVAAVAAFAAVSASAASLGGITSENLGADTKIVAACDTAGGVSVAYTTSYSVATKAYVVDSVQLGAIDPACGGQTAKLTLSDSTGASLGGGSAAVPAGGGSMTFSLSPAASAASVVNVAVVISG